MALTTVIIKRSNKTLHVGITTNLTDRLARHNNGKASEAPRQGESL
ncbi:MAG: GIY-YIG nuclease family protein [Candidatus Omnitrophica bacterium]|nr:GIY-YIG nuclease family protein [Candidatus Omnitrophota bacterium]